MTTFGYVRIIFAGYFTNMPTRTLTHKNEPGVQRKHPAVATVFYCLPIQLYQLRTAQNSGDRSLQKPTKIAHKPTPDSLGIQLTLH